MLIIDGSYHEGGGQILRTALTLSLATRTPFRIEKIRAGRKRPGLLRQHLAAVKAAAQIGNAEVRGAEINSTELTFSPQDIVPGEYRFAIGSAGSTTLVLQTVLPVLMLAGKASSLTLEGGTHNMAAPPYDFIEKVYLPVLRRIGAKVQCDLLRAGFYPAGGGVMRVAVEPHAALTALDLTARGEVRHKSARALVANLPRTIAAREAAVIAKKLPLSPDCIAAETVASSGPGNVVMLEIEAENITEMVTGFGELGVRAETVADRVCKEALRYLASNAPVGEHLADQLLLPLALAKGGVFATLSLSAHTRTNIDTIQKFLPTEIRVVPSSATVLTLEIS